MASSPFFAPTHTIPTQRTGVYFAKPIQHIIHGTIKFPSLKPKAVGDNNQEAKPKPNSLGDTNQGTKPNSLVCADCDGNGSVQCTQCKGGGLNTIDHFNGKFIIGDSCWLCGGKKDILCGNCNGAGFVGGFLSGFDN